MAHYSTVLGLCVGLALLAGIHAKCSQTYLPDMRQYRVVALHGRFLVSRHSLKAILRSFKKNNLRGRDVEVTVPHALPGASYDEAVYGEIVIADVNIQEMHYDEDLGKEIKDDHRSLLVTTPFQSGETHGVVVLGEITDGHSHLTSPMIANRDIRIEADSVDVDWNPEQTVTYRKDGDLIRFTVRYDAMCDAEGHVGEDYSNVIGDPILSIPYTGVFDWGCEAWDHGYCDKLEEYRSELDKAGGNVCVGQSATDSRRCNASVRIDEITGIFQDKFPYLAVTVPNMSLESEFLDRGHHAGIKFPCLC